MDIELALQLLRRAHEYEAYITSKLTIKNEHSSEELFQLRCRAKRKFPELREKPLTKSVELALFDDMLHRLALKLGFHEERLGLDIRYFRKN
ncbi:hypothetical protein [Vibrio parahaemolyticus]|uniref:hypothetical protein n=1 Tax=Vibrio parahaemolyticus TaxID=670 RepID=UPI00067B5369|nr:hypothetical protein [Vibrio parahaemolyticus]